MPLSREQIRRLTQRDLLIKQHCILVWKGDLRGGIFIPVCRHI